MKHLLGKFHAELSQQRLAEPSQAKPSLLIYFLSGKFHEKFVRKIS